MPVAIASERRAMFGVILAPLAIVIFVILNYKVFGYFPPFIRTFENYPYLLVGTLSIGFGIIEGTVWYLFAKSEANNNGASGKLIQRVVISYVAVTLAAFSWFGAILFIGTSGVKFGQEFWKFSIDSFMLYTWAILFLIRWGIQIFMSFVMIKFGRSGSWVRLIGFLCLGTAITYLSIFLMPIGAYIGTPLLLLALCRYFMLDKKKLSACNNSVSY
ncbi:hypothetical protein [Pseudidiomarina aquimaris]|nr:hypothetical protein [Pseudidiomarina aquimaris]